MESCLNKFASAEISDETMAMVHGGRSARANAVAKNNSNNRGAPTIVFAPVINIAVAINIATQIGGSNSIIQGISIGQWGNLFG